MVAGPGIVRVRVPGSRTIRRENGRDPKHRETWDRSQVCAAQSGNRPGPDQRSSDPSLGPGFQHSFNTKICRDCSGKWLYLMWLATAWAESGNMALARTGNVDSNELYTFFTNDTNAFNNIVSISGQVFKILQMLKFHSFSCLHFNHICLSHT